MDSYVIWFNLKDTSRDLEFCAALDELLGHMRAEGAIEGYRLVRRKLGFGPTEIGEFMLDIKIKGLAQLDQAYALMVPRTGETEKLHARVWSRVTDFRAGLFRDFPDAARQDAAGHVA